MSHRHICARSLLRVVLCWQKSTRRLFHPFHRQGSPSRILQPYRFVLKEYFGSCSCLVLSETTKDPYIEFPSSTARRRRRRPSCCGENFRFDRPQVLVA